MQLIIICQVVLALTLSGVAQSNGAEVGLAQSNALDELKGLVSKLRFELRQVEPKSKRCSDFLVKLNANEQVKLLINEQTGGDNTQVDRLLAVSSLLQQNANSLNSLVAFVEGCASELSLEQAKPLESQQQAVVVDAGAAVEKATAELEAEKAQLAARVRELEATVERVSEANEAQTKLARELNEQKAQLESQLVKLQSTVESLSEANEANGRELAGCGQKLHELEARRENSQALLVCESELDGLKTRNAQQFDELDKWRKNFEASEEQHKSCNRERVELIQRSDHMESQWKRCEKLRG